RLLYVAATRAMDHLVLVGHIPASGPARGSWMAHLAEHHGLPLADADGALAIGLDDLAEVEPPAREEAPLPPPPPPDAARWFSAVPDRAEIEVSPSSLDRFIECPARWALSSVLRVPEGAVRGRSEAS